MKKGIRSTFCSSVLICALTLFFAACGGGYGGGGNGGGGGGGGNPPTVPTGLTATSGNAQIALSWSASSGATSYNVSRGTTPGGPYTKISSSASTSYTDTGLTNGTTYYYVVSATNSYGTSANSSEAKATPSVPATAVNVSIDLMTNRHTISPYVYGVNFPLNAAYITNTNATLVRWGGNASSTYNWQLGTYNADNDYFFEDFTFCGFGGYPNPCLDSDSAQWIKDVKTAGGTPLMTIVMLPWVAQSPENGSNGHWSYSVMKYGAQCKTDPFNPDAGNGLKPDCTTQLAANPTDAYFPLLDDNTQACPSGNCVYRHDWVTDPTKGLAQAFGSGNCQAPYFSNASCHFYDMDNEIDIWGGTHVDVHPNPTTYNELRDIYLTEAAKLKMWDPQAVRFGWVSCCWGPYWGSAAGNSDKNAHANIDFMPWWINEVYWNDLINSNSRTLDGLDLHAYPETSANGLSTAQQRALALNSTRDWWDPTYTSQAWFGGVDVTANQPSGTVPFRIPRVRAILNSIYPGTPMGFTEWNFALSPLGDSDFSTALADVDAWGILGRERATFSTRWTAAGSSTPAYNALLLYRNYDGSKSTFNPISVSAAHNANPGLFSVYAATDASGKSLTVMVVNKDPSNAAQTTFSFNGFTPSQVTTYTLSQASPNSIVAGSSQTWSSTMMFQPYTATLLVISGTTANVPPSEWDLNPDTIMAPASGTVTLAPQLTSGTAAVNLNTAVFDSFEGAAACNSGSISLTNPSVGAGSPGKITVNAPASAGFCHFSVTASDGTTQGGWILVTKPAATLAKTSGDGQTGTAGTMLPVNLKVTLSGSPTGSAAGASVFFTITSATGGSLTNVQVGTEKVFSGTKVIAVTDSSGVAQVKLTLPATAGPVTVTAEGPYAIGHPVIATPFNETAN